MGDGIRMELESEIIKGMEIQDGMTRLSYDLARSVSQVDKEQALRLIDAYSLQHSLTVSAWLIRNLDELTQRYIRNIRTEKYRVVS